MKETIMTTSEHTDAHGRIIRTTSTDIHHEIAVLRWQVQIMFWLALAFTVYTVASAISGHWLFMNVGTLKTEISTWQHIERAERFDKALPPDLKARIKATQARIDPGCGAPQMNVNDIPDSFVMTYQKAARDSAGMLTAPCTARPETAETFYAGIHYPDPR